MTLSLPFIFGASVAGESHKQLGVPCQDAWVCEILGGGFAAFAIADGLGSAANAEQGARAAVSAAMEFVENRVAEKNPAEAGLEEIVRSSVHFSRSALERMSEETKLELSGFACTLMVGLVTANSAAVAHVGDGAAIALTKDGFQILSGPGESEYVNEVVPLTSPNFEQHLRTNGPLSGVECLAAFTDGCQRAGLVRSPNGLSPLPGFFAPIFDYAREQVSDIAAAGLELEGLLASPKLGRISDDDKTLVIAVLSRRAG